MKIPLAVSELFRLNGETGMANLLFAFRQSRENA